MKNKSIKKQIKDYYLGLFMKNSSEYKKMDMRTYANYDDYKDIKYVTNEIIRLDNNTLIQFRIKKSHLRLMLEVIVTDNSLTNGKTVKLYQDLFHLKRKDKVKTKVLNITDNVDYKELMKLADNNFMRKIKLELLKNKI